MLSSFFFFYSLRVLWQPQLQGKKKIKKEKKERSVIFTTDLYEIPKERDLYLKDMEYQKENDLEETEA